MNTSKQSIMVHLKTMVIIRHKSYDHDIADAYAKNNMQYYLAYYLLRSTGYNVIVEIITKVFNKFGICSVDISHLIAEYIQSPSVYRAFSSSLSQGFSDMSSVHIPRKFIDIKSGNAEFHNFIDDKFLKFFITPVCINLPSHTDILYLSVNHECNEICSMKFTHIGTIKKYVHGDDELLLVNVFAPNLCQTVISRSHMRIIGEIIIY
jgi:hypothetical protein